MFKIIFIGSGCWQGIPAPFGEDSISRNVEWGSKDFRFRTSLYIETEKGKKILVEVTPDIRLQSWKFKLEKPDSILISHWHWDHLFGLLDLDWFAEKNAMTVYGNKVTKKWYTQRMEHIGIDFHTFDSYESFGIDNVKITPITVCHVEETHGFLFEDKPSGKKFVYLSDLYALPPETVEYISGVDAITVDATYIESDVNDDETHLKKDQIKPFLESLNAREIILTNIGSYHGLTHDELERRFPQCTIAYDGMERKFSLS